MTTTVTSSATTTEKGSRWWTLLLPSMITALVWAVPPALSFSSLPPVVGFIGMVVMLTSPAVVAVGIHFDRKYVASVSEWETSLRVHPSRSRHAGRYRHPVRPAVSVPPPPVRRRSLNRTHDIRSTGMHRAESRIGRFRPAVESTRITAEPEISGFRSARGRYRKERPPRRGRYRRFRIVPGYCTGVDSRISR